MQSEFKNFLTQPLFSAEFATGIPGKYVPKEKTVADFERIVSGECDNLPEQAFYMVGTLEEVFAKAEKMLEHVEVLRLMHGIKIDWAHQLRNHGN